MENEIEPQAIYITFTGFINEEAVIKFQQTLGGAISKGVQTVHLAIHSHGGNIDDSIALYYYLTGIPLELITHNIGVVQSGATFLHLAGHVRRSCEHASFMIHKTTFSAKGDTPMTAADLTNLATGAELADKNSESILRAHISMPDDKWAVHSRANLFIGAEEAKLFGIIHEITNFSVPFGATLFAL